MRKIDKHPDYYKYKELLREAFKHLRRRGLYARMNFRCCTSCATYELHEQLQKNNKKIGFVYWHGQNEETLERYGYIHLGYDSSHSSTEKRKEVGRIIIEVLRNMDIPYEWNGDPGQKITAGRLV